MELALAAPRNLPPSFGFRVTSYRGLGYSRPHISSPSPSLRFQKLSHGCRVRAQATNHFGGQSKLSGILRILSDALSKPLPGHVREFPWKEAEVRISHRLLHLGRTALKGFLLAAFFLSFASDLVSSFSRSRELVIPLGLVIGVTAADFLVETSKELFQSSKQVQSLASTGSHFGWALSLILLVFLKARDHGRNLLGVGAVFACTKLLALYTALPGRMVLTHVGNGGLMQVLWLARQVQETDSEKDLKFPAPPEQIEP